jgi:hypothetical protein
LNFSISLPMGQSGACSVQLARSNAPQPPQYFGSSIGVALLFVVVVIVLLVIILRLIEFGPVVRFD